MKKEAPLYFSSKTTIEPQMCFVEQANWKLLHCPKKVQDHTSLTIHPTENTMSANKHQIESRWWLIGLKNRQNFSTSMHLIHPHDNRNRRRGSRRNLEPVPRPKAGGGAAWRHQAASGSRGASLGTWAWGISLQRTALHQFNFPNQSRTNGTLGRGGGETLIKPSRA